MKRALSLLLITFMALAALPAGAQSNVNSSDLGQIQTKSKAYFTAISNSDAKALNSIVVPDFTMTSMEGQKFSVADLTTKVRKIRFEVGNVSTGQQFVSAKPSGQNIVAYYLVTWTGAGLSAEGAPRGGDTQFRAGHELVWTKQGSDWKLAADTVVAGNSAFQ